MSRNSGVPVFKTNCEACGSSDANQVFEQEDGTRDAFCFACDTVTDSLNSKGKGIARANGLKSSTGPLQSSESTITVKDISNLPSDGFRGINKKVVELFNVKVGYSKSDGSTITKHYYPTTKDGSVTGYEERTVLDKKFRSVGDRKGNCELFGTALAKRNGGKKLYITEGACDAMALYQAIVTHTDSKYKAFKPSVVSLTRGATTAVKDLINNRTFVEGYNEVVLVLDNDEAGKKAVKEVLKTFHDFKVAELPLKDANEMLEAGRTLELYQKAVWGSAVVRQGEVVDVDDALITEALVRPKMGLEYPWPNLNRLTYGIRPHNIVILGAAPKQGKSEFKNQLVHHLAMKHGRQVGVYDLEVHPVKTLKQIASKEARTNFLKPDNDYDDELLKDTLQKFKGKLSLYDRAGSRDWSDIRVAMEEQHLLDGVCEFFLDPLTALVSRYTSSEANDALNEILTDMADLVNKYPITIFAFSHLNPKAKGVKSHEQGGKVLSSEFTGSRSLEKWSNLGLGIERDRSDDCPLEERNHSKVKILYCRDFGNYGSVPMFYDADTTEYLETNHKGY